MRISIGTGHAASTAGITGRLVVQVGLVLLVRLIV